MVTKEIVKILYYVTRDERRHLSAEAAIRHEATLILGEWLEADGLDADDIGSAKIVSTLAKRGIDLASLLGVFVVDYDSMPTNA